MHDLVTGKDISLLNHDAFRKVLNALIVVEANMAKVPLSDINLTTRDTDPDGGVDGRIVWPTTVSHAVFPAGNTVVQYKSGKLTDLDLKKEFVKPGVISNLKSGGNYVLFVGHDYVDPTRKQREKTLKELCKSKRVAFSRCKIFYGDQIARWVSCIPGIAIMPELGKSLPSFVTIKNLSGNRNLKNPYKPDAPRQEVIERIRAFVRNPTGDNVLRVEGPAGVGKTRILLEALNLLGLAERSLYCANADDEAAQQLLATLVSSPNVQAVIVLDECDSERQEALKSYADMAGGRIVLICAGVADVLFQAPIGLSNVYVLRPLSDADIQSVLNEHTQNAPSEIVDAAVRLSGGYVKLSIFIFNTLLQANDLPLTDLAKIYNIREFLKRFVSESTYKTLQALSLLAKVGWRDERRVEAEALAKMLGLPMDDMKTDVARLRDQGVVIVRGFSLYVSPDLLAISAAAAMWDEKGPELIDIVEELPGTGPKRQLLRRLATMHQHKTVIEAVTTLLGPTGLYKTLEDLDQGFLSEVFRFFASTLPRGALEVLERLIPDIPLETLRGFRTGRREVMWAIESLLRWPETSLRAARILIRLAVAENERISNNATGIAETFFHAFLSGSPVPLIERLALVDELISSADPNGRILAAKCAAACMSFHESRMGNDFDYISKRNYPKEWRATTWGELWDARRYALDQLWKIADASDEAAKIARVKLLGVISTLVRDGQVDDALSVLKRLSPETDAERLDFLESIHRITSNSEINLTEAQRESIAEIQRKASPDTLFDRIRRWLGRRTWFDYDLNGSGFDKADQMSAELADQSFVEGLSDDAWRWLSSPAAENVWVFGRRLGEIDSAQSLLSKIMEVSPENINAMLLSSYLSGKPDSVRDDLLDEIALSNPTLAFVASWRTGTTVRAGTRLLRLMDEVSPKLWGFLKYGAWLKPLPDEFVVPIVRKMLDNSDSSRDGASAVMHMGSEWATSHDELLWKALTILPKGHGEEWEWGQLAQMGIRLDPARLADLALRYLLEDDDVHLSSHPTVQSLAGATRESPVTVWKMVAKALLNKSPASFRLLLSLQHWYGELVPSDELVNWATRNGRRARIIVAELISVSAPLPEHARQLIIAFPEDDDLLNIFAGQLFAGSWVGPMSGHTESVLDKIQVLESDPNPRVSAWASRLRIGTVKQLEQEKLQEEDDEL